MMKSRSSFAISGALMPYSFSLLLGRHFLAGGLSCRGIRARQPEAVSGGGDPSWRWSECSPVTRGASVVAERTCCALTLSESWRRGLQ